MTAHSSPKLHRQRWFLFHAAKAKPCFRRMAELDALAEGANVIAEAIVRLDGKASCLIPHMAWTVLLAKAK